MNCFETGIGQSRAAAQGLNCSGSFSRAPATKLACLTELFRRMCFLKKFAKQPAFHHSIVAPAFYFQHSTGSPRFGFDLF